MLLSIKLFFHTSIYDDTTTFIALMLQLPHLFYADFQDLISTVVYYSPDLIFSLHHMVVEHWLSSAMLTAPALVFDSYQDVTSASNAEFTEYMVAFLPFISYVFLLLTITRITTLFNVNDSYVTRAYLYLYSISNEVRFQLEAWTKLLCLNLIEFRLSVKVMSKADEVISVRESDYSFGVNFRHREDVFEHIADAISKAGLEIIQDEVRVRFTDGIHFIF